MNRGTGRLLASRPVEAAVHALTGGKVRVLAYHDVPDAAAFEAQMAHLAERYVPTPVADLVAAVDGDLPLPERAAVVTFDDGIADVVERAMPVLVSTGVPATLFVCPGPLTEGRPHWFDTARAAARQGWTVDGLRGEDAVLRHLKQQPDEERRAALAGLEPVGRRLADLAQLQEWCAAGLTVGNHTWDHPCLDRCTPEEIEAQVRSARGWIESNLPGQPTVFAYPNGDWSPAAERALDALGERVAFLFDHRLASLRDDRHRISRLRIDSRAELTRARTIMSGAHSTAMSLRPRR